VTPAELRQHCTREALRIWRQHAANHSGAPGAALMPLLLEDYHVGAELLFVGMNPSFSSDAVKAVLHREFPGETDVNDFFSWVDSRDAAELDRRAGDIARFEAKARVAYDSYFKPLREFADAAGAMTHAHIDMFLMRHTSQQEVKAAYIKDYKRLERTPFAFGQFILFLETLKAMRPKVVVVFNAAASDLAVEGMRLESPDGGRTYRWSELPEVPVFLCGMLSGQRALDTYSRKRLALDVKVALEAARD
jgi:hypothetical protein